MKIQLSENERMVYDVVREYLDNNRIFEFEKVSNFIQARFRLASININNEGIEKHLTTLVEKKILVPNSKLTRDMVFYNQNRNSIYNFIKKNPGVYLSKIMSELGLSINTIVWHITILENFNFIASDQIDNRIIFFDSTLELNKVKIYYFTSHDTSKKILQYLKINDFLIFSILNLNDLKLFCQFI